MAKEKRASWFKIFLHQKPMMDAVEDAVIGRAVRAAMAYFEDGTLLPLDPMSQILFASMKPFVDEALEDFRKSVENGKKGGRRRTMPNVDDDFYEMEAVETVGNDPLLNV